MITDSTYQAKTRFRPEHHVVAIQTHIVNIVKI